MWLKDYDSQTPMLSKHNHLTKEHNDAQKIWFSAQNTLEDISLI
jgi:hypothetical protein